MVVILRPKTLVFMNVRYYMPDYQNIIQEFMWQLEDQVPEIPRVHMFLNYWKDNIEATIKEVIVSSEVTQTRYTNAIFYKVLN
jgi:uncharacterized protein Usg